MTFGQPLWFWALGVLPVMAMLFFANEKRRAKLLRQLVAARLQDRLAGTVSVGKRRLRFFLLMLALGCVVTSLAQPRLGSTWEQSKRKGRDVLIAIDCSRSMLATDLAPNRLARAKLAAQDLIGQLEGDRVGLIAFAGTAFLQAPLTVDYGAILNSLAELNAEIIPRGGTDIAAAIKTAVEAFGKGESDNRGIVLFTDGEELDEDGVKAAEAQNGTLRIFTVGLGSADGSLIPIPGRDGGTEFVKDESGQIVKSRLDEDRLRKIAEATGGFYVHLQNSPAEMQQIVREGLGKMNEHEIDVKMSRRPIERYQWPLSAALALLASTFLIGERKRTIVRGSARRQGLAATALAMLLFAPGQMRAKNPGVELYEKGGELLSKNDSEGARKEFEEAHKEFSGQLKRQPESPAMNFNLGTAAYRLQKEDEALLAFGKASLADDPRLQVDADAWMGNTLFRRGEKLPEKPAKLRNWKGAVKQYDAALKIEPGNATIRAYRDWVQSKIDELEKETPKSDDQKKEDKKDDQKKKDGQQKKEPPPQAGKNDDKQKQDPKNGQQQDSKSEQQPPENKQGSGSQGDPQPKKDGEKDGRPPENKDGGEAKKDARGDAPPKDADAKNGESGKDGQPPPLPNEPEKKRAGEIGAQTPQPQNDAQREADEAQAGAEGKMTEAQAQALLESLKGDDQRVQLLKPNERQTGGRVLRDW